MCDLLYTSKLEDAKVWFRQDENMAENNINNVNNINNLNNLNNLSNFNVNDINGIARKNLPIIRLKIEFTGYQITRTNFIISKFAGK